MKFGVNRTQQANPELRSSSTPTELVEQYATFLPRAAHEVITN
jgi:hypothetical protein